MHKLLFLFNNLWNWDTESISYLPKVINQVCCRAKNRSQIFWFWVLYLKGSTVLHLQLHLWNVICMWKHQFACTSTHFEHAAACFMQWFVWAYVKSWLRCLFFGGGKLSEAYSFISEQMEQTENMLNSCSFLFIAPLVGGECLIFLSCNWMDFFFHNCLFLTKSNKPVNSWKFSAPIL